MPRLQVALDVVDLDKALAIASRVVEACGREHLMLEAGTPLIKARGVEAVRHLSAEFRGVPVVADMKIVDVGGLEAQLAIESGAKYVTVLAVASNETIEETVNAAHELGGKVVGDLISVADPLARAAELRDMGVDVVCYHVPVDVQRRRGVNAEYVTRTVSELKKITRIEVAVAGGITPDTARAYAVAGADVLIVGKFVYAAEGPGEAARSVLRAVLAPR